MTKHIQSPEDLGTHFGHQLYAFEVDYLLSNEWAQTAEDILLRRTKIGLFLNSDEIGKLEKYIKQKFMLQNDPSPIKAEV
jgi:glycerol-3-phosphate dehydrogenase